jgi:hypothetical protein
MSRQRQQRKQKGEDQGGVVRSNTERQISPRAGVERPVRNSRRSGLPNSLANAGNAVVSEMLNSIQDGKPLGPEVRYKMERAYGDDFADVRLHDDSQSREAAETITAKAFTRGDDIYLGRSAPPMESEAGKALIAHELAHVTQQRRADNVKAGAVSKPGDRFERAADMAAEKAVAGRQADSRTGGAPPSIQRQPAGDGARRPEVEQSITAFLEKAKAAQGGRTLQITTEVRQALEMLASAGGDPGGMRLTQLQALLDNSMTPRDPAALASKVAQLLPDPFDRSALKRLEKATASKQAPTSKVGRVADLVKRSAPGSPEAEQEKVSSDKTRPRNQREEIAPVQAPGVPSAEQRAEYLRGLERTVRGEKEPGGIAPKTIDVLRAIRIVKGLPGALKGPRQQSAQPRAQIYPEVKRAIEELVSPDALIPAEVSGRAKRAEKSLEFAGPDEEDLRRAERRDAQAAASRFENAQDVAGRLAALLDIAHEQGSSEVDLPMEAIYNDVKERRKIYGELIRIAVLVRNRLPHRAAGVTRVNVYFGKKMVLRIPLDAHE